MTALALLLFGYGEALFFVGGEYFAFLEEMEDFRIPTIFLDDFLGGTIVSCVGAFQWAVESFLLKKSIAIPGWKPQKESNEEC